METNLEVKYVYVIDDSLKMSKGKIAAQVSHVAMQMTEMYPVIGRAIVLKTSDLRSFKEQMDKVAEAVFFIKDAGLTEVPAGSLTCIGFKETHLTEVWTKDLKLV